jgi:hypothetical protein
MSVRVAAGLHRCIVSSSLRMQPSQHSPHEVLALVILGATRSRRPRKIKLTHYQQIPS